jgi:translation initiation factor 1
MEARRRLYVDRGQPLEAGRPSAPRHAARGQSDPKRPGHPADGCVRVSRETKGRKGKGVTLVTGLRLAPEQMDALCRELKQRCGAGGSVKSGVVELQGDHRDVVLAELQARGFTAKLAGG